MAWLPLPPVGFALAAGGVVGVPPGAAPGAAVTSLVIAAAGLDRLGRENRIDQRIDPMVVPPAPGQGALAIQARRSDARLLAVLAGHDQPDVRLAVEAERSVLEATGGTCRAPVGALATVDADSFTMVVGGVNSDGSDRNVESLSGRRAALKQVAVDAGRRLAGAVMLR